MATAQIISTGKTATHEDGKTLLAIAIFKLAKGVLLLAVGLGALRLLHRDVAGVVMHWVNFLRVDPDNRLIHRFLAHVLWISPHQLRALSIGTFIYSALLLTEGIGLLLRKTWAEYFTIVTTAGLIPLELYEIAKRLTTGKIAVLLVNVAIVLYLIMRVARKRLTSGRPLPAPTAQV